MKESARTKQSFTERNLRSKKSRRPCRVAQVAEWATSSVVASNAQEASLSRPAPQVLTATAAATLGMGRAGECGYVGVGVGVLGEDA